MTPLLLSVPKKAVSPEIDSSEAIWMGSPAATSTQPNSSASQSTAPPVGAPVPPVPSPSSSPHAAATSVSAANIARTAKYLRFLIEPPSGLIGLAIVDIEQ